MTSEPVRLCILGSTGSIGKTALRVVDANPGRFKVVALAAHSNGEVLLSQAGQHHPLWCALTDEVPARQYSQAFAGLGVKLLVGEGALSALAGRTEVDTVVLAVDGVAGLEPLVAAIEAGKSVALANKEALVAGGALVKRLLEQHPVQLTPIDSEHSAVFQCMACGARDEVKSVTITASGGPFWSKSLDELKTVSYEEALRHPLWKMGQRNTVNSATLANKALEVIEAHFLFDLAPDDIRVLVHPQGILHGMVEFVDGSLVAQLATPDMALPVQYALGMPTRLESVVKPLHLDEIRRLEFHAWDATRFPALALAYDALRGEWWEPVVFNAMNEALVNRFLAREISFWELSRGLPAVFAHRRDAVAPALAESALEPTLPTILELSATAAEFATDFPASRLTE